MRITTDERRGIRVLSCEGSLTIGAGADALEEAFEKAIGKGGGGLVLDFTRVTYLDSAGVGSVVMCAKRGSELATVVKIVLVPVGATRRIFTVTQLELAFEIFDSIEKAIASFA